MIGIGVRQNRIGFGGVTPPTPFENTYSLDFDGVDDYVKASLDGTTTGGILAATNADINLTISCWVKIDSSAATQGILQWAHILNSGYPFILIQQNSLEIRVYVDGGYRTAISFSLATWYNITVTRDSTTNIWTGYLNGSSFFTYDDGGGSLTNRGYADDIYLGNGYVGYMDGNIDEVSIFNTTKAIGDLWDGTGKPTNLTEESGLVAWWRNGDSGLFFNGNWELKNQPQIDNWSSHSFSFDGIDDYVDIGSPSTGTGTHTISMWINPTSITYDDRIISNIDNTNFSIRLYPPNLQIWGNSWGNLFTAPSISVWTHIAFVFNGDATITGYKDGVEGSTISTVYNLSQLGIGARGNLSYGDEFHGLIDEVSIFDAALDAATILSLYNSGEPNSLLLAASYTAGGGTDKSGDLQGYWRMGEGATWDGSDWTIPDDSTNSNDGTSVNMAVDDKVNNAPGNINQGLSDGMGETAPSGRSTDVP